MSNFMTLLGAEQVHSSAGQIASAAAEMRRAAGEMSESLRRHEQFLTEWLMQFEQVLRDE